jgi:guanylate kinase
MMNTGNLIIISAASGAGKTSLINALLSQDGQLSLSVSHTTRQPRVGEENGVHYHFVNDVQFMEVLSTGGFLESATVHSAKYGTSQKAVDSALKMGQDVILEIDWQGAEQVRKIYPQATSIFILPPSLETLEHRLNNRGQDSTDVIVKRLAAARDEMRHVVEFDYVIINDAFDKAVQDLSAVVRALRLTNARQLKQHAALIQQLT